MSTFARRLAMVAAVATGMTMLSPAAKAGGPHGHFHGGPGYHSNSYFYHGGRYCYPGYPCYSYGWGGCYPSVGYYPSVGCYPSIGYYPYYPGGWGGRWNDHHRFRR
jgi:hypothetical protein